MGHFDVVNSIAWSEDMSQIATASGSPPPDTRDTTIRIWNPATGVLIRTLSGHLFGSTAVDYTPDNQFLISGGRDNQVKYWRQSDGKLQQRLFVPRPVDALQVSPSGAVLAVAVDDSVLTFDVPSGVPLDTIPVGAQIVALDWSPDDSTVALALSTYGDNVKIYDTRHGTLVRTFAGDPLGFEQAVAFSADGQVLYSGSGYTHSLQAWRVSDAEQLATYDREFPTMSIDVHPTGALFAYGRNDATVVLAHNPFLLAAPPPRVGGELALRVSPNPMQRSATVSFTLARPARVELTVFDVGGRTLRRLVRERLEPGAHRFGWDGGDDAGHPAGPGIYFAELSIDGVPAARHKIAVLH